MKKPVALPILLGIFAVVAIGCGAAFSVPDVRSAFSNALRHAGPNAIAYVPIDPSVFVSRKTVTQWADAHNETEVSKHALKLWQGLAAPTNEYFRGVRLPVYDTWFSPCEIFGPSKDCGHAILHQPTTLVDVQPPEQFFHFPRITATGIISGVLYNAEMRAFVDTGYKGSPYTTGAGLKKAMNDGLKDLPDTAATQSMMVKPTYELFSATEPTVITYWAGPGLNVKVGSSTSPLVPDATTWLKVAIVDPTGKVTNDKPVQYCANTIDPFGNVVSSATYTAAAHSYLVVPLKQFYALPVTQSEIKAIETNRAAMERVQMRDAIAAGRGAGAKAGCKSLMPKNPVAALVGMHVVTAELKNVWTWQTFWWNPEAKPLPNIGRKFRYFEFATAYWTIDRKPYHYRYAFNPYLEAGFGTDTFGSPYWNAQGKPGSVINLGITTNCISCHQEALYVLKPDATPTPYYVAHGTQPQIVLPRSIKVRNLWSLAIDAGHP